MSVQHPHEEEIFLAALERTSPEDREALVEEACRGDEDLRRRVRELLDGHDASLGPLDAPPPGVLATEIRPVTEQPGDTIGPYKLLQQIGEGGFGVVYMAEQTMPVRRKVALKIIKPGMDTKEVIARFEAERQALALMEHPNIAKVLDGGTTETGRPYFVMELVKGIPITQFCDENKLETHQRLRLFISVCRAIQHAHQKGVIHRDIKPSNVLVTLHDGEPVPRVIDFGVAKAISQQLTERTMFTAFGQMIGTPQYMSPEQAEMSGLDVDTRSDIYSLGVLLYELLTGSTPLDPVKLRETAFHELQRMIREDEPPKPSTRLTTLGEQSVLVASNRGTSADKLGALVKGDLDWIVMQSLEKNRERRYDTANALAADVERFLQQEPVEACPPSLGYRLKKYVQRNRQALLILGTINALLFVGIVVSSVLAVKMLHAQRIAEQRLQLVKEEKRKVEAGAQSVSTVVEYLMRGLNPNFQPNRNLTVSQYLEKLANSPDSELPDDPRAQASIRHYIGVICHRAGLIDEAQRNLERALGLRQEILGDEHVDTARTKFALAYSLLDFRIRYRSNELKRARTERIDQLVPSAIATLEKTLGTSDPETLHALAFQAFFVAYVHYDFDEAETIYQELLARAPQGLKSNYDDPLDLLGSVYFLIHRFRVGRDSQVDEEIAKRYRLACEDLPEKHPQRTFWTEWYGMSLYFQGKVDEADPYLTEGYTLRKEVLGEDNYFTFLSGRALAALRVRQGNLDRGIELLEEVLQHVPEHASQNLSLSALYLNRNREGDRKKWLAVAERMLEEYEHTDNVAALNNVLEVCLMVPAESEDEQEMQNRAVELSRQFRAQDRQSVDDPAHYGWKAQRRRFTIALAEFRSGYVEDSSTRLEQVVANRSDENERLQLYRAYGFALQATIAARAGGVALAHELIEKARKAEESAPDEELHNYQYFSWNRPFYLKILIREAEAEIESSKSRELSPADTGESNSP